MTPEQAEYIEQRLAGIESSINSIESKLFIGNGVPSLYVRLDRIEQRQGQREKHFWLIYGALVMVGFYLVGDVIQRHFTPTVVTAPISTRP